VYRLGNPPKQSTKDSNATCGSRPADNRVPPPDTKITTLENEFQKKKAGPLDIAKLSLKQSFPTRPAYGTRGQEVILFANYFELKTAADLVLYRYSLQVEPDEKGKKLAHIVRLFLELPEYAAMSNHLVTDFKSMMFCRKRLGKAEAEYQVQYRSEGEDEARPNATTYTVKVKETGFLTVAQLVAFLTSTSIDLAYIDKQPTIQALNIFMGHLPKASPARATIGANKSFLLQNSDEHNLGAGLTALRGYFCSVRVAAARILVNVNVTHAPFYKPAPLLNLVREFGQTCKFNLYKTEKFLKTLRVKVIHIERKNKAGRPIPRIRTIFGLANQNDGHGLPHPPIVPTFGANARDVQFFLDESAEPPSTTPGKPAGQEGGKGGGKKKKGKQGPEASGGPPGSGSASQGRYISVYDYFKKNYPNVRIENPVIPVVNVGTRAHPSYLPVDACVVEPGQTSTSKLTPQQTKEMITFAVRKPWMNAQSIVSAGPGTIGMTPQANPLLANFGISMDRELITVHGRVLPSAKVNYKNSSAEVRDGSWNMLRVKFNTAATLKRWTSMIIHEGGVQSDYPDQKALRPTMAKFFDALKQIGLDIAPPDPGYPPIMVNSAADFPKIEEALKKIVERKYDLIFVILPTDNTIAYDYLKTSADKIHGIHTVCSVSSKFAKENNQYFNNVALKFNLKLGGINQITDPTRLGVINEGKTMVIGIDVTHPSPGSSSNAPSVAAMVATVDKLLGQWPVALRVQTGRQEMVADLGSMLKSRLLLWRDKNKIFPENLLVYRDGVSDGQYDLVLDKELPLLRKACAELYPPPDQKKGLPRFTVIICGKRHHTRFYPSNPQDADRSANPRSGTVVDRGITDPHLWDFYLQAHTALQGTARSCHYIVILDEILRKRPIPPPYQNVADVLEDMTYCMCHLFGRATKSVSLCPPAKYADLACERARKYLGDLFDMSQAETPAPSSVGRGGGGGRQDAKDDDVLVHPKLRNTMFYL
jgi:hypothetical protein